MSHSCDPRTVACQASLSMRLCRQEYWSGLPCSLPGDLPDPGTEPASLVSPALAGGLFITSATWETQAMPTLFIKNNACIKLLLLPEESERGTGYQNTQWKQPHSIS